MNIEIKNWENYNPRKDLKSLSWLRLDSDIGFSESLFGLSAEAKWLWVFLLSFSAKKNKSSFDIDLDYIAHYSNVKRDNIPGHIESFLNNGLIVINQVVPESVRIRTNPIESVSYERTNEHNEHLFPIGSEPDAQVEIDSSFIATPQHVFDLWNSGCEQACMSKVLTMSEERLRKLKKAIKRMPSMKQWEQIFTVASTKGFVAKDGRPFIPNFDFVFNKENYIKFWEQAQNTSQVNVDDADAEAIVFEELRKMGVA